MSKSEFVLFQVGQDLYRLFAVTTAYTYGSKESAVIMPRTFYVLKANLERVGYLPSLIASNDANKRVTCDYIGRKEACFIVLQECACTLNFKSASQN